MAVDPDSLAVAIGPMACPPHVIGMTHIVTRAVGVVWSITNLDGDRARITCVIRAPIVGSAAVIGSAIVRPVVSGVSAIIAYTTHRAERGGN